MNLLQISNKKVEGKEGILKVPLVRVGKWAHKAAKIIQFTLSDLEELVRNFNNNILQHKPYLTYGHVLEPYSSDSHRKKGDLVEMSIENNILYGYFKAKESTYQSVLNGDYEFASVEYVRDYMDPKTGNNVGMVLLRTALTNSPFLPGDIKIQALSQKGSNENISDRLFTTIKIQRNKNMNNTNNVDTLPTENNEIETVEEKSKSEVLEQESKVENNNADNVEKETQESNTKINEHLDVSEVQKHLETVLQSSAIQELINGFSGQVNQLKKEIENIRLSSSVKNDIEPNIQSQNEDKEKEPKELKALNLEDKNDKEDIEKQPENEKLETEIKNEKLETEIKNELTNNDKKMTNEINNYIQSNSGPLDIKGLVKNIRDRVGSAYQAQIQDYDLTVKSLQQQLNELKNQAEEERKKREIYALSLQEAQSQAFLASTELTRDHLIGNGVPPELANQFIIVQSSYLSQKDTVKLSLDGSEAKDMDITEALCELFIRAVACNPVNLSVSGFSSFSQQGYDPSGRTQRIKQIIERNRKKAEEIYKIS
ncbi:hypothetical protein V6O07_00755 [Arthrospira platensis SPKY2]